ncbi:hypothetical protein [Gilliamella sp. ESL0254]|uniref:hypothetical protein n=1 Tax=Gilliamella sp. ESL0254 TaxID=2705035 RepID=UPI001580722E|nr:hypothetical protein [Gilliamella sp. ESL0254]NUF26745.1 hypothetical protein [Gilliamella sp. ESL0254]
MFYHRKKQSYILNLFNYYSSQKQNLSSLLSLNLTDLSQPSLFFAPILLLPFSLSLQALSAQTSNVIQGTAPYLTFDDGATKVMSFEGALGIKLANISYIPQGINSTLYPNAIVDTSNINNPIEMPNTTYTFADIQTIVPIASYPNISLTNLVNAPYNYGRDDDGDGDGSINATGNLTIKWQDSSGKDITEDVKANPNMELNFCNAPYQLTLSATDGYLSTEYGIPKTTYFNNANHSYYINPNRINAKVCFAQPSLHAQQGDEQKEYWVRKKGFKVQPFNNPTNNFPTTGSNKMFFYLLLAGITPEQVIAVNGSTVQGTGGNVTLQLSAATTHGWGSISYPERERALKVELIGPTRNSTNTRFLPTEFKLYSDNIGGHLIYNFKIERWFIPRPGQVNGYLNAQNFCRSLGYGYRIPGVEDYTNANRPDIGWNNGIPGRNIDMYRRALSYRDGNRWVGGFFNEWGVMSDANSGYPGTDWSVYDYWAYQARGGNEWYSVGSGGGNINTTAISSHLYNTNRAACVSP